MIKNGPAPEWLEKVKLNLVKRYKEEEGEKDADYWGSAAFTLFVYGLDKRNYEKTVSSVTPAMVQQFANKILSQGNIIEVVMDPKK